MPIVSTVGSHKATVTALEMGQSEKGTPFARFSFLTDKNEHITDYLYFSEKAFEGSVETLQEAFQFDGNFDTIKSQVVNKQCLIETVLETYEGKQRMRVKWINPLKKEVTPIAPTSLQLLTMKAKAIIGKPMPKPVAKPAAAIGEPPPF